MPKNDHNKTVGSCMFAEIRRRIFERRKGGVGEWIEDKSTSCSVHILLLVTLFDLFFFFIFDKFQSQNVETRDGIKRGEKYEGIF